MTEPTIDPALARWLAARLVRPEACPDEALLFAFATGAIGDVATQEACVQHLAGCAECRAAVQIVFDSESLAAELANDLEVAAMPKPLPASAASVPRLARNGRARQLWPLGLAAAAALVLTVVIAPWRTIPDFGAVRAPAAVAVQPPDLAVLRVPPTVLRWPCTPAAASYEVSLLDATAQPFWQGQTSTCDIELDPTLFARRQGSFYWRVTPGIDDAPSSVFAFELQQAD